MGNRGEIFTKVCSQCGEEFSYMKSNSRKYCSKKCANLAKRTGHDIVCDNCGKPFYRRQYHIDRQQHNEQHNFCCPACQKEYLHKQTFEIRVCEVCGEEFEASKLSTQRFCSEGCQHQWQTTNVGELNPKFTSILTPCTYCGKPHYVKPYKFDEQDNFFCSKKCRQKWYAEVYSQREEWREESRQRILKQLQNGDFDTETIPQQKVNEILCNLKINYRREEPFVYYAVDNYLLDYNLIVEVQGDYWHANPLKFTSSLTNVQYRRINRDKAKHSFLKNKYNIEVLYLWETDIIKHPDKCALLIQKYVEANGILDNYQSFNYSIENDILTLNDSVIIPYQDMVIEQYKNMLMS